MKIAFCYYIKITFCYYIKIILYKNYLLFPCTICKLEDFWFSEKLSIKMGKLQKYHLYLLPSCISPFSCTHVYHILDAEDPLEVHQWKEAPRVVLQGDVEKLFSGKALYEILSFLWTQRLMGLVVPCVFLLCLVPHVVSGRFCLTSTLILCFITYTEQWYYSAFKWNYQIHGPHKPFHFIC